MVTNGNCTCMANTYMSNCITQRKKKTKKKHSYNQKVDSDGYSVLKLACMSPCEISDKMVNVLLTHPKIKPESSVFEDAVLHYNYKAATMLLDPTKYDIKINLDYSDSNSDENMNNVRYHNPCVLTQTEKNDLLIQMMLKTDIGKTLVFLFVC